MTNYSQSFIHFVHSFTTTTLAQSKHMQQRFYEKMPKNPKNGQKTPLPGPGLLVIRILDFTKGKKAKKRKNPPKTGGYQGPPFLPLFWPFSPPKLTKPLPTFLIHCQPLLTSCHKICERTHKHTKIAKKHQKTPKSHIPEKRPKRTLGAHTVHKA